MSIKQWEKNKLGHAVHAFDSKTLGIKDRKITNHSVRKTMIKRLVDARFNLNKIAQLSGNTGEHSVLYLCIVHPYSQAKTVRLELNIFLYCHLMHLCNNILINYNILINNNIY